MASNVWTGGFTPNLRPGEEMHTAVGDLIFSVRRLKPPGMTAREAASALLSATDCICPVAWPHRGFHLVECRADLRKYVEVLSTYVAEQEERL